MVLLVLQECKVILARLAQLEPLAVKAALELLVFLEAVVQLELRD
jgi:hypothetical protein